MITPDTIIRLAEKYGLKIVRLDTTDVTFIVRIEILPMVYIEVYGNSKKQKLNLALIIGKARIFGVDGEGGFYHEHPPEDPESHNPIDTTPDLENFIIRTIELLKSRNIL